MALKLPSFKFLRNADAKSRVFIIFALVSAVVVGMFLVAHYFGGGAVTPGGSKVATAPSSLQTVPGAQMTPEFYRAVMQANAQAASQAKISGGSAVPTLVNIPGQQTGFPDQNCTVLCAGDDNPNVADDIGNLVKQGKLSQEDANTLLELAKNNVSVDEYAAALNELVRQGKLTPEQARALLEKYKKQHANTLLRESGLIMDPMIKTGQLPLGTANQLLMLQKSGISPAEYGNELNRLAQQSKLPQNAVGRLLAQYTQQQMREKARQGAYGVQQMVKAGQITADVGTALLGLQAKNTPTDQYDAELSRLVSAGKMTPAAAAKLSEAYRKQRAGMGTAGTLSSVLGQHQAAAADNLNDLVKSGKLTDADANILFEIQKNARTSQDCQAGLSKFFQTKKVSPEDQQKLLQNCQKLAAANAAAQRLADLQGNNVSVEDYATELKRLVQAGIITPEMAARLLDEYRAMLTPVAPPTGNAPGADANIPGGAEFSQLQQRLQAGAPGDTPAAEAVQFANVQPSPQVIAGESDQDRQQRLNQLQTAMSNQAQSLLTTAWQAPQFTHVEGAGSETTPAGAGKGAAGGLAGITGAGGKDAGGKDAADLTAKKPLIKAGTILFAVLDTAVNSDYPDTPVMATVVQGPFKGAKLLGKLALAPGQDRVSLNFNLMDKDDWISSKTVSAFAIDPDTARTVMASDVDYHYLKRYGAMMGSAFVSGYANAITNAGATNTTGIFGTSTVNPQLSAGSKLAVGLGQVGTTMGNQISNYINTPATVKVNSGAGLGILFMAEVGS